MVNSGKMFETLGLCKLKGTRVQTDGGGGRGKRGTRLAKTR